MSKYFISKYIISCYFSNSVNNFSRGIENDLHKLLAFVDVTHFIHIDLAKRGGHDV